MKTALAVLSKKSGNLLCSRKHYRPDSVLRKGNVNVISKRYIVVVREKDPQDKIICVIARNQQCHMSCGKTVVLQLVIVIQHIWLLKQSALAP
jgi:hypothetical protein